MINLHNSTTHDITGFARDFWRQGLTSTSNLEGVAQYWAQAIYNEFRQGGGQSLFALVRIYRLVAYNELPSDLKKLAAPPNQPMWTLFGTYGDETSWCDRRLSKEHKVAGPVSSPMFKAVVEQIALESSSPIVPEDQPVVQQASSLTPYIYIEKAAGNPYIPKQLDFVEPYGIKSVVAFGCKFLSRSTCLALAFSKVTLNAADAERFAALAPYVCSSLAHFDGKGALWA